MAESPHGYVLSRVRFACGASAAAVGGAAFLGWLTGWRGLAEVRPGFIPMAPNTAVGFVLDGLALAALAGRPKLGARRHRLWSVAPAGLASAVAAVRLAEYATGQSVGVDRWVLRVPGETLGLAPVGKMALLTAAGFLAAGVALILAAVADRRRGAAADAAALLGLAVAGLGGTVVLGYLYDSPFFYGGRMIPMAANTAFAFAALGAGTVAAAGPESLLLRPVSGTGVRARLLRAFLPLVVGAVGSASWATFWVSHAAGGRLAAIFSAAATAAAVPVVALLGAHVAGRVGLRIEQAEDALRRANDELEARVAARTAELAAARDQLAARNRDLERAADDLAHTAESIRLAHEDLQSAHKELQLAESQLVQAEKLSALGQMVAGVAHEINNPLAFVTNNVAVLQRDVGHVHDLLRLYQEAEGTLEVHQHELLNRIRDLADRFDLVYVLDNLDGMMARSREGLKRIEQIVRDLRDFVRLDEGDLKSVDVNDGVRSTASLARSLAVARGVAVELDLNPLPATLCYPAKLNQVVLNLLSNAIDASAPGSKVVVATRPADAGVELTVADAGHGIDPAVRSKIFDPFFTTKPVGRGTGLGLSISLGIVRSHGGTIHCESEPGRGTRFVVRIPPQPPPAAPPPPGGAGLTPARATG